MEELWSSLLSLDIGLSFHQPLNADLHQQLYNELQSLRAWADAVVLIPLFCDCHLLGLSSLDWLLCFLGVQMTIVHCLLLNLWTGIMDHTTSDPVGLPNKSPSIIYIYFLLILFFREP